MLITNNIYLLRFFKLFTLSRLLYFVNMIFFYGNIKIGLVFYPQKPLIEVGVLCDINHIILCLLSWSKIEQNVTVNV